MDKIEIFTLRFLTLKRLAELRVYLAIELPRDVVYILIAFVCFVFHGAAPIPHVQAAILNLPHL